jgi:hypothetical protein
VVWFAYHHSVHIVEDNAEIVLVISETEDDSWHERRFSFATRAVRKWRREKAPFFA